MARKAAAPNKKPVAVAKPSATPAGKADTNNQKPAVAAKAETAGRKAEAVSEKSAAVSRKEAASKKAEAPKKPEPAKEKKELKLVRYFKEVKAELRMVVWPTRREGTKLTLIVLAVTASMSVFLGLVDWLLTKVFTWIISL